MFCKHCGHELNDEAVICPNCGVATDNFAKTATATATNANAPINGLALAGMICSIVGLIGGSYFLCIPSIIGLILSIVGMVKVKELKSGYAFALSGIIVGAVGLVIWLCLWIFLFWMMFMFP